MKTTATHSLGISRLTRRALGVLLVTCVSAQAAQPASPVAAPAAAATITIDGAETAAAQLESKAIELLKAMSARLAAARTMTFTATTSYESPSVLGPALVYSSRSDVTLQRPDKLRVITPGDGPATEFYYDGKTMTAFAPAENLVASAPAPATIDATLAAAFNAAAIYFPFTDLVVADPYGDLAKGLKVAFYIGQSNVVGGTTTDMVAFANNGVFAQIWIGANDKLPRKLRAVYLNDPLMLRHDLNLSNWKIDPKVSADAFSANKAAAAIHVGFARPDETPLNEEMPPSARAPVVPEPTQVH